MFSNRGWVHALTDEGRRQGSALAERLASTPISRVLTSPLRRAVETAQILSDSLGLSYEVTDALREFDRGTLEGTGDEAGHRLFAEVMEDWLRGGHWDRRIEGGESLLDMRDRFLPLVEELVGAETGATGGHILVGHGGLYRCMLPLVLTNVDHEFAIAHPIAYAGCVVAEERASALVCVEWGGRPIP